MTHQDLLLGKIAALAVISLTLLFIVAMALFPPADFVSAELYTKQFRWLQLTPVIPSFLLVLANIPLIGSIYQLSAPGNKSLGLAGLMAATGYFTCSGANYFIQLTVLPMAIERGDMTGVAMFSMFNQSSLAYTLDHLGYLFLAIAFIFLSFLFGNHGLASWIKTMFILYFFTAVLGAIGYISGMAILENMVLLSALPYLAGVVLYLVYLFRN